MKKRSLNIHYLKRLLAYTSSYRWLFYSVILLGTVLSGLSVLRPWITKKMVDEHVLIGDVEGLINTTVLVLTVLVLEVITHFSFLYYANWIGQSIVRDMRCKLFHKLLRFRVSYFDNSSVGVMVTRTVSDLERVSEVFSHGFFEILSDIFKLIAIIFTMLYVDWELALISFSTLPPLLYATRLFQKAMKKAFIEVRLQVSNLNSFVQERISGMKIVQLFGRESIEYEHFESINQKHKRAWLKTVLYNSIFFPLTEISAAVTAGFIVWYGGLNTVLDSELQLGTIIMFIQLSRMMFNPLRGIADRFNTLQMGIVASNRVYDILDTSEYVDDNGTIIARDLKGKIVFDKVYFSYVKGQEVLRDISFSVKPGQTVAIVGATGAGKSTISSLLNRFYDVDKGTISIDGCGIKDFSLESLRSQVCVVLQDVFLSSDTIMNNITLNNVNIKEKDVFDAAKAIGIYDFVMSLPGGFDYNVKERGHMLSAGQRQFIAFLRAYVYNPSILILDEATSSMDTDSEQLIQTVSEKITKNRTSIIVAHRLATVKKASEIFVMSKGRIVEQGTHDSLLTIKGGYYKKLHDVQLKEKQTT